MPRHAWKLEKTMTNGHSPKIMILTRTRDFHAYVTRFELICRGLECSIVETDNLASTGGMSWSLSSTITEGCINDIDGKKIRIADLDLIWWRRLNGPPRLPDYLSDEARDLVANDCRGTLLGLVTSEFKGRWVSHPEATRVAENKLVQLKVAAGEGLRVPLTLVSQDPSLVREFCQQLNYQVVVKSVVGSPKAPVMTGRVTPEIVKSDESIRLSPAIYQELIPGNEHLRVCCFGDDVYAALLKTDRLDWRYPLDAKAEPYKLDNTTAMRLKSVLYKLGLRMGIFDLKLTPSNEPVWLEVNPQGQFLFLEGMCGMPLTKAFSDFIVSESALSTAT
jgi:hypothetical protein